MLLIDNLSINELNGLVFEINGIKWDVEIIDNNSPLLFRSDGSQTIGVTDCNTKTVYIAAALRGKLLEKVLTHEICHCAVYSYGIYLTLDQEEKLCDFVATYGKEIFTIVDKLIQALI